MDQRTNWAWSCAYRLAHHADLPDGGAGLVRSDLPVSICGRKPMLCRLVSFRKLDSWASCDNCTREGLVDLYILERAAVGSGVDGGVEVQQETG